MASIGRALALLPPGAITGIGSLPHTQMEMGLQMALAVDVPYLPQLPSGNPHELMVPAALEGLPGLEVADDGSCLVDLATWEAGQRALATELEQALRSGEASRFLPTPASARALQPFLFEVRERKLAFAKAQLAGPATVRWSTPLSGGGMVADHPGLDGQIFRLLLVRALALVQALRAAGTTPLFYLDEPGLVALNTRDARHLAVLTELRLLVAALRREGALVGLHCCGNTRWAALLDLGLDLLSFDVRLSLDALLESPEALRAFLDGGGGLSLGIVPTNLGEEADPVELVRAAETSFAAAMPEQTGALRTVLLTPACGLGLRSVSDAEQIFASVRTARSALVS
jgi:hypothetical protein